MESFASERNMTFNRNIVDISYSITGMQFDCMMLKIHTVQCQSQNNVNIRYQEYRVVNPQYGKCTV